MPRRGVRVDTGVYEGGEIPMYYDSMIAKLIVHGRDRARRDREDARGAQRLRDPRRRAATSRSRRRCSRIRSSSPATSTPASSPSTIRKGFRAEDVPHDDPDFLVALAAACTARYRERAAGISGQLPGHGVQIGERLRRRGHGRCRRRTRTRRSRVRIRTAASSPSRVGDRRYEFASDWRFGGIRVERHLQRRAVHRAGRTRAASALARASHNGAQHRRAGAVAARRRAACS